MTFARARVRPLFKSSPSGWTNDKFTTRPLFIAISGKYGRTRRSYFDNHWINKGLDGLCSNQTTHFFPSNGSAKAFCAGRKLSSSRFSSSSQAKFAESKDSKFNEGIVARGIRKAILSFDPTFFDHDMDMKIPGLENTSDLAYCRLLSKSTRRKLANYLVIEKHMTRVEAQFDYLIMKRLATPRTLWTLYRNLNGGILRESLNEQSSKFLSMYLFENMLIKPGLLILLENLPIDGVITTLSNSIIPAYIESDKKENSEISKSIILGDIIQAFIEIDQLAVAKQLLSEIATKDDDFEPLLSEVIFLLQLRQSCSDIESAELFIGNNSANILHHTSPSFYPQLLSQNKFNIWTKLSIYRFMVECDLDHMNTTFVKKRLVNNFLSKVLRRFIQYMGVSISESTDSETKLSLVLHLSNALKNIYYNHTKDLLSSYLTIDSLLYLPTIAYDKKSYHYAWNSFTLFLRKIEGKEGKKYQQQVKEEQFPEYVKTPEHTKAVNKILERFLKKAVQLKLSLECSELIAYGHGEFHERTLRDALLTIVWGKKKLNKFKDNALYFDASDDDTVMLERAINAIPNQKLIPVLNNVLQDLSRQYPFSVPCPGRILWHLLLAMQRSESLAQFPFTIEKNISSLIVSRPHLEQVRYMALSKVTTRGIKHTLEEYVIKLRLARQEQSIRPDALAREADLRLVLSGLSLLNEREEVEKVNNNLYLLPSSEPRQYFGKMVTNMFKIWNEKEAVEILKLLQAQDIQLSNGVIIKCLAMLLRRDHSALALQVLNDLPRVPPTAYYAYLIHSSRALPKICFKLMNWLKHEKNIIVPSNVIRKMIIGFAYSSMLNDSESNRRIAKLVRLLQNRGESITPQVAQVIVNSIISRAKKRGWGSRERLEWAIKLAKKENVPQTKVDEWRKVLDQMKKDRQGYWGINYYHRPHYV